MLVIIILVYCIYFTVKVTVKHTKFKPNLMPTPRIKNEASEGLHYPSQHAYIGPSAALSGHRGISAP